MYARHISIGHLCVVGGAVFATVGRAEPRAAPAMRLPVPETARIYQGLRKNRSAPASVACISPSFLAGAAAIIKGNSQSRFHESEERHTNSIASYSLFLDMAMSANDGLT